MRWKELSEEDCSMARTVSVIGDRWTLLILRDCFLRVRRFEDFQERLGITRPILASRLKKLVDEFVLVKVPYQQRPVRYEYRRHRKGSTSTRTSWRSSTGAMFIWPTRKGARYCTRTISAARILIRSWCAPNAARRLCQGRPTSIPAPAPLARDICRWGPISRALAVPQKRRRQTEPAMPYAAG